MSNWSKLTDAKAVYRELGKGPQTKVQLFSHTTCHSTRAVEKAISYVNHAPLTEFHDAVVSPVSSPWLFTRVARSTRQQYRSWLRDERYLITRVSTAIAMRDKAIAQGGVSTTRLTLMIREVTHLQQMLHAAQMAIADLEALMALP